MKLVIDANVFISALLKNGRTRELLLDDSFEIYSPLFLKEEVLKYKSYIARKTGTTTHEAGRFAQELATLADIKFVDAGKLDAQINTARKISPDPKDTIYIALALSEACPLWSNDGDLKKKQSVIKVITTSEVYELIHK